MLVVKKMGQKDEEWAKQLLREKAGIVGRLPKKDDFCELDMTRIKAYLGPWPRALEKAGLKEPKRSDSPTKHPHHKSAAKKADGKDIL